MIDLTRDERIAAHRARIQYDLRQREKAAQEQRELLADAERARTAPRTPQPCPAENRLVAAWIERLNMMARNYGWSL